MNTEQLSTKNILAIKFYSPEEITEIFAQQNQPEQAESYKEMITVCQEIKNLGGRAFLNGGTVRDFFLGKPIKDLDLEIHHLSEEKINEVLENLNFKTKKAGKSYGVIKATGKSGQTLDLSLPRQDQKTDSDKSSGRGISVLIDKDLPLNEAAKRRDFTFNAMYADPLTGEIFDFFGGVHDLKNRTLRITDETQFSDDPLRVFRGIQFCARFGLVIENKTAQIMTRTAPRMIDLSGSKFLEEWRKLLLMSAKPSIGLLTAQQLNILRYLNPALAEKSSNLKNENADGWLTTLTIIDRTAELLRIEKSSTPINNSAFPLMLASLCHELTEEETVKFLQRITLSKEFTQKVLQFKKYQNQIAQLYQESLITSETPIGKIFQLARKIFPATITELAFFSQAVAQEENYDLTKKAREWILQLAKENKIADKKPNPVLRGQDLISIGIQEKQFFGKIISLAEELREISNLDKDEILALLQRSKSAEIAINILADKLTKFTNKK